MNHPSANNRSLPLGTSNYLYKTIIPQNNDYFPVYEFNLPKLDLRVVVKIVCNANQPLKLRLRYFAAHGCQPQPRAMLNPPDIETRFWFNGNHLPKDSACILHLDVAAEWVGIAIEGTTIDGKLQREFFFTWWKDYTQSRYKNHLLSGIRIFQDDVYLSSFQFVSEDMIIVSRLPKGHAPAALDFYDLWALIGCNQNVGNNLGEPYQHASFEFDPSWNELSDISILRNNLDICSRWTGGNKYNSHRIFVISLQFRKCDTARNLWPHTLLVLSDIGLPPNSGPARPWADWSSHHRHMLIEGPDLKAVNLESIDVVHSEVYIPGEYEVTYQFGSTLVRHFWVWFPSYNMPPPTETHHPNEVWPYIRRQRYRGLYYESDEDLEDVSIYDAAHPFHQRCEMTEEEKLQEMFDEHTYLTALAQQSGIPIRYHAKPRPSNASM